MNFSSPVPGVSDLLVSPESLDCAPAVLGCDGRRLRSVRMKDDDRQYYVSERGALFHFWTDPEGTVRR